MFIEGNDMTAIKRLLLKYNGAQLFTDLVNFPLKNVLKLFISKKEHHIRRMEDSKKLLKCDSNRILGQKIQRGIRRKK